MLIAGILLLTAAAVIFQANNPLVVQEPPWDSPQTRELAVKACFDCHSNETRWPWFTKLPFGSWLAVTDTIRARKHLNFSEWGVPANEADHEGEDHGHDFAEVIQDGSMPPARYTLLHPNAVLTEGEKQELIDGLQNTLSKRILVDIHLLFRRINSRCLVVQFSKQRRKACQEKQPVWY